MIFNKNELEVLTSFLKPNSIIKFSNNDNRLKISYFDNSNILEFEINKEWDFSFNEFYVTFPSLNFVDSDLTIQLDLNNIYLYLIWDNFEIKLLLIEDYFSEYKIDLNEYSNVSIENIEDFLDKLKKVFKTIITNEDDFTSGIYLGQKGFFGTNRITATWIKESLNFNDIVIDNSFLNKIEKIISLNYKNLGILIGNNKIGYVVNINEIIITYLSSLLSVNYPDFSKIFSNFTYDCSVMITVEYLKECLSNLVKLNNKDTMLKLSFSDEYLLFDTNNFDNSEFVKTKIPIDYIKRNVISNFNVNLLNFNRVINDLEGEIIIDYNSIQKTPLKIKLVDNMNFERYIQIMNN